MDAGMVGRTAALSLAVALSVGAGLPAPSPQEPERVPVVVAGRDLHPGVLITEDDLDVMLVEPRFVAEHVFLASEDVIGRIPADRVLRGEPVRAERLADADAGTGLHALVPRGSRAITVLHPDGLRGFVGPGSTVDVLLLDRETGRAHTALHDVHVLAVRSDSVTLVGTPDDMERVALAERQGDVRLTISTTIDCCFGGTIDAIEPPGLLQAAR